MVISFCSYGHLNILYNPQQVSDDRSILFSEDVRSGFFLNDCRV